MKRYIIRDREAGNIIETTNDISEAKNILKKFESEDKAEDIYEENFYEIYDTEKEERIY